MQSNKNFFAIALIVVSVGVAFYVWKYKISQFEIDYTKVTFADEKVITDCAETALKNSQNMGKTKAELKHFDFYCRCITSNTSEKSNIKETVSVQKNCWTWAEEFFSQPGLFDK